MAGCAAACVIRVLSPPESCSLVCALTHAKLQTGEDKDGVRKKSAGRIERDEVIMVRGDEDDEEEKMRKKGEEHFKA